MPRVFDVVLFDQEVDLLALRLEALRGVVTATVLVEGDRTFQGAPKPPPDLSRFRSWPDRLHVHVAELPEDGSPWAREETQRDAMTAAVATRNPADDDLILLSDVDEIPRPEAIPRALDCGETGRIGLKHTMFYADLQQTSYPVWYGPRFVRWCDLLQTTPQALRGFGIGHTPQPGDTHLDGSGGVHLSFLGGVAAIQHKLQSWAHAEANRPRYLDPAWLERCLSEGNDWYRERDLELRWVEPDGAWPQPLLDQPERYAGWFGRMLAELS